MYNLINNHIQQILQSIPDDHVTEYDWLINNLQQVQTNNYQSRYKIYWGLNAARPSNSFCKAYFDHLHAGLSGSTILIGTLANDLYQIQIHKNRYTLQFSFCSKLCHMMNTQMPIYDAMVRDFYFFKEPSYWLKIQQRIDRYVQFHQFLVSEYGRILNNNLLSMSIQAFRQQFNPQQFTDEKIIDSLIWAFVSLQKNSAAGNRPVIYC